jgi:hypothetical protein
MIGYESQETGLIRLIRLDGCALTDNNAAACRAGCTLDDFSEDMKMPTEISEGVDFAALGHPRKILYEGRTLSPTSLKVGTGATYVNINKIH